MKLHDISPMLSSRTAVFPGDTPFSRQAVLDFAQGDVVVASSIQSTVHIGAHVDAPSHYHPKGQTIDARKLELYLGECQVVEVSVKPSARILPTDLDLKSIRCKRVLFKTGSFPNPDHYSKDFNSLSPELIRELAKLGVKLVGIDTPSIDPWDSQGIESHHAVYDADLAVLEGILLEDVRPGVYTLVALPLKIDGGDASPVRAVLIEGSLSG